MDDRPDAALSQPTCAEAGIVMLKRIAGMISGKGRAEHYGVSRATVAKALRRIAGDGLVEVVPQWGTFRT
jgi:hypothetical protein